MSDARGLAIDNDLVAEAETLGIDFPREIELHLRNRIEKRRRELFRREQDRNVIELLNEWIEKNGVPFEEHRPW